MIKPTEPEIAISNRKDIAKFLYKQQYTKFIYELAKKKSPQTALGYQS